MTYKQNTACVHLFVHPEGPNKVNIFVQGEKGDLMALLITAARMNDTFHDAFLEGAKWLERDER
jgi:hypothetical protein